MESQISNQEKTDERLRKMADDDLRRAVDMYRLLDRVFGTITAPTGSAGENADPEVRVSGR